MPNLNISLDKKNILIASNNSISSKFIFHTICDIAESYYRRYREEYNVYFLSQYSDVKRVYRLFQKESRSVFFDSVILSKEFTEHLDYCSLKDWLEVYHELDLSSFPKFERIIEVGSALSEGNKLQYGITDFKNLFLSRAQFKFLSGRKQKENILLTYKLASNQNIELEHFIIDPQEVNYGDFNFENIQYPRRFPYTSEKFDFLRDDAFLDTYIRNSAISVVTEDSINLEKEFDFTFGYTILTEDRSESTDYLNSVIESLDGLRTKIFLRDKYNNIDTFIKKDEYLHYIRKTKFTLIIPSYNNETFSAFRYIESIYSGCVPLILRTTDISEAKKTLYIPECLIVTAETIRKTIEEMDYSEVIRDIKEYLKLEI